MAKTLGNAICLLIATALTACLAALSAGHWIIQLEGQPNWVIEVAVIGSVCVSLLVGVCAYLAGRGFSKVLILSAIVFLVADTYQNGQGWQTLNGLTVSGEVTAVESTIAAAQSKLAAVKLPERDCLCPKTKAADLAQYEAKRAAVKSDLAAAKADLAKLNTPKASDTLVSLVMGLLQIALAVLFGAIGRGSTKQTKEAAQESIDTENVVVLRPNRMTEKDMRVWGKIAKV